MKPTIEQMKSLGITPNSFDKLVRLGFIDGQGRSKQWWEHQRLNHNEQFEEERERKPRKVKFKKEVR